LTAVKFIPSEKKVWVTGASQWHGKAGGRVFLSEDAGSHWDEITGDLPESGGISAIAMDPERSLLYVSCAAGSVFKKKMDGFFDMINRQKDNVHA
jgi:hypothetical protein